MTTNHDELYVLHEFMQQQASTHAAPANPMQVKTDWRETLPTVFPTLADFARKPLSEIVFTVALATGGGALVGGILIPTAYELAQGKFGALPYSLWGISLWLACAGWLRARNWKALAWFLAVLFIISSWV